MSQVKSLGADVQKEEPHEERKEEGQERKEEGRKLLSPALVIVTQERYFQPAHQ